MYFEMKLELECLNCRQSSSAFTMCYNSLTKDYDIPKYGKFYCEWCSYQYSTKEYNELKDLQKTNPSQVKELRYSTPNGTIIRLVRADSSPEFL